MTRVPEYLRDHVAALMDLQGTISLQRWLISTGQTDSLSPAGDRCPPLTDGTLVHQALDNGDLGFAREFVVWFFRENLAEATSTLRQEQRSPTVDPRTARKRWLDAYAAASRRLGFDSHGALVRTLYPDVDRWVKHAEDWLATTRDTYLDEARHWRDHDDMVPPRLSDPRQIAAKALVPQEAPSALETVRSTMRDWRLETATSRVVVDTAARPGKVRMAFCSPIAPPSDVRVSVVEGQSLGHYATMLHEFGHALHFSAGMTGPFDLWRFSTAMSEAFGFMLELVVRRHAWQTRHLGSALSQETVERTRFGRDHVRRIVAASLCYEMAVHDGATDPAAEYQLLHEREFGVAVDGAAAWDRMQTYLEGQPCYPLVYHQAFTVRDELWNHAVTTAGEHWYVSDSGGEAVRSVIRLVGEAQPEDFTRAMFNHAG